MQLCLLKPNWRQRNPFRSPWIPVTAVLSAVEHLVCWCTLRRPVKEKQPF